MGERVAKETAVGAPAGVDRAACAVLFADVLPRIFSRLQRDLAAERGDRRLKPAHHRILHLLAERDRQLTGLARDLGMSLSTASETVDQLVRCGFAERIERAGDRRAVPLHITAAGRQTHDETVERSAASFADILESLPAEAIAGLQVGLTALDAALRAGEPGHDRRA
jgi:DNA-binding MarR family transcriptional regulator